MPTERDSLRGLYIQANNVLVFDDADIESFFDSSETVDLTFRTKYFERLVIVPRGGDSGAVRIAVSP